MDCKGRAIAADHVWGKPEYYTALGIQIEVTHCMSCGERKVRGRWHYIMPEGFSEWRDMMEFEYEPKGESSEQAKG